MAELTGFISPTDNVACMIEPSRARCDIIDRDWSLPPRPADCELDYGQGITLSAGAPAEFVCAGDTAFGPDEVLPTAVRPSPAHCAARVRSRASPAAMAKPVTGSRSPARHRIF